MTAYRLPTVDYSSHHPTSPDLARKQARGKSETFGGQRQITAPQRKKALRTWRRASLLWSRLGSNQRPSACEADALPLSHGTVLCSAVFTARPNEAKR